MHTNLTVWKRVTTNIESESLGVRELLYSTPYINEFFEF